VNLRKVCEKTELAQTFCVNSCKAS